MKRLISIFWLFSFILFPAPVLAASLSLTPGKSTVNPGCAFTVSVDVDTEGAQVSGVDALLKYNPNTLKAAGIINGNLFNDYPGNTIDPQNGKVNIYALTTSANGVSGKGSVATVNFNVLTNATESATLVQFDFQLTTPPTTTGSNVVQKSDGSELLKTVNNGLYTVAPGKCSSTALTTTPAGGPQGSSSSSPLPSSGTEDETMIMALVSIFLIAFGLISLSKWQKRSDH